MISKIRVFLSFRLRLVFVYLKSFEIKKEFGKITIRLQKTDLRVFDQIFLEENYQFFLHEFNPKVIIDVGANVGYSAIWFSHKFKDAKVIALEPEEENFKVLKENCQIYPNIFTLKKALWSESGRIWIKNSKSKSWSFETVKNKEKNSISIEAIDMRTLVQVYEINRIDLLKIDIEGAEKEIFEGEIDDWIKLVKCIMIETHDRKVPGVSSLVDTKLMQYDFIKFKTKDLSIFYHRSLF
ncbi:FkbM family methyltransferase [Algoriphagus taiwanensis]|uniref:Methyltransferase FkbM domain-containing protein n=1 Tax=Algoriphagus taiwanensis TaxID=1445656 RepID=A0ABQ6Q7R7_9BACT|nr:hypothetical protein Ataiwa_39880 [Algoriphagus taiwanensis]